MTVRPVCYEDVLGAQIATVKTKSKADVRALPNAGETWVATTCPPLRSRPHGKIADASVFP